ncbi:hypothetical protein QC764_114690 [Podospora pseudoanserina]|uniref:Uncharacterized protein n=1 Tax=Podospora pseudoanserina TaxID=2609844 RepID=A0ABR0IPE1_9PEZI|nr:hypothetical protein QC764_114690 [Podospora pseudoanserina]
MKVTSLAAALAAALAATLSVAVAEMAAAQADWPDWPDWEDLDWTLEEVSPLVVGKGKGGKGQDIVEISIIDPTIEILPFGKGKGKGWGKGNSNKPAPLPQGFKCKPGSYACEWSESKGSGWKVCNVLGEWVYGGSCGKRERCEFNLANKSPYCLPYSYL